METLGNFVDGKFFQSAMESTPSIRPKMATISASGIFSAANSNDENGNSGPVVCDVERKMVSDDDGRIGVLLICLSSFTSSSRVLNILSIFCFENSRVKALAWFNGIWISFGTSIFASR